MIFNSLVVLITAGLTTAVIYSSLPLSVRVILTSVGFLIIAADAAWLNRFAWKNPRFLTYGPYEYLRESELAHEREMAQMAQPEIKTLPK